jgi:hypothetical protein
VQNQIKDLSGVIIRSIKNPLSSSSSNSFEMVNPMRRAPNLGEFDWDSLSKRRFDTQTINAINAKVGKRETNTSDIHIEILGSGDQLRRNSSPESVEVVTPNEHHQRD